LPPPAFPAGGGNQLVDNDRATIWEFVPAPGSTASPHRHAHDAVVLSFAGEKPRISFITRGTVHTDDGGAGGDRLYVFEIK
jgi:predicted metal-dependent enzyme (double-stranded beta helix superfamily)